MAELTRRAFLFALGLVAVPSVAHAHHRPRHQTVVVVPPQLTITEA